MSALLQMPRGDLEPDGAEGEQRLVAAVRRGDDRAFEALYQRYHRRIHAYVLGMVKDHQRAEDVTQEVFVSALRRMRATERPIAFKPWVYEIAKNACIDQFRRSRRAEEVSYNSEDGLAPADYGRLVSSEPVPDQALDSKQQLDHLCGAFGGLSDAHHEILVLRELEGLSYREIGERMGMSRPAVESTLFRARRRLSEEYDELASGARCVRIQAIIAGAGSGRLGARDTRRLARHVAHCQPCRRQALAAGAVDPADVARRPLRERAAEKVAALFPVPLFLRGRRGAAGDSWLAQLPFISDHASAGGAKVAAVAALLVAGLGAGVGSQAGSGDDESGKAITPARATQTRTAPAKKASTPTRAAPVVKKQAAQKPTADRRSAKARVRSGRTVSRSSTQQQGSKAPAARTPTGGSGREPSGGGTNATKPVTDTTSGAVRDTTDTRPPTAPVTGSVGDTVDEVGQTVGSTVDQVGQTVGGAVDQTGQAVGGAVDQTGQAVGGAVDQTGQAVGGTVDQTGQAVGGTVNEVGGAVGGAVEQVEGVTGGLLGG